MTWDGLTEWWVQEVRSDAAYDEVITPLVMELLCPGPREVIIDLGCGEGRVMRALAERGAVAVGIDIDRGLLGLASTAGPVLRSTLPVIPLAAGSIDAACVVLVLEHLADHQPLVAAAHTTLRPGGRLVVVLNHPLFTAPDSGPVYDSDGELLWRPGRYFDPGYTEEPAGDGVVRFHHRTTASLINSAADIGFSLERMVELGPSDGQIARTPTLFEQQHIPRLLGLRWRKASGGS